MQHQHILNSKKHFLNWKCFLLYIYDKSTRESVCSILFPFMLSDSLIFWVIDNKSICENHHCSKAKENEFLYTISSCCRHLEWYIVCNIKCCFIEISFIRISLIKVSLVCGLRHIFCLFVCHCDWHNCTFLPSKILSDSSPF